jgi:hypothetical protein
MLAGDFNEKTMVTFAAPAEIPGKALPAGTYVFKIIDSSTENNIIQVFDKSERHLFATFLAVADHHLTPGDKTILFFDEEKTAATPQAVRALFCGGDQYARIFVYPHESAVVIARRTHQTVLQTRDEKDSKNKNVTAVDESGKVVKPH